MTLALDTPLKFLRADGSAPIGRGIWHLPQARQPGQWMRQYKSRPIMCRRGYHYTTIRHAVVYADVRLFLIEPAGVVIHGTDKSVAQGARLLAEIETWNARTQRLFAANCAERVVHLCGDDPRPRAAIEMARRYARGEATKSELDAAWAAAWDATWAAAGNAARAAARAAAWAAAWDAPWTAAGTARAVAGAAAGAAPRDAAWDAAWDAEREWQSARLLQHLNGEEPQR